jgi:hypothetical protein
MAKKEKKTTAPVREKRADKPSPAKKKPVQKVEDKEEEPIKTTKKKATKKAQIKIKNKVSRSEMKKRNFVLLNTDMEDIGRYTGKSPRQAALKVANSGVTDIRLRESGVRRRRKTREGVIVEVKIHKFTGKRVQRKKIETDPEWMPDKVNVPKVTKKGVEWVVWRN